MPERAKDFARGDADFHIRVRGGAKQRGDRGRVVRELQKLDRNLADGIFRVPEIGCHDFHRERFAGFEVLGKRFKKLPRAIRDIIEKETHTDTNILGSGGPWIVTTPAVLTLTTQWPAPFNKASRIFEPATSMTREIHCFNIRPFLSLFVKQKIEGGKNRESDSGEFRLGCRGGRPRKSSTKAFAGALRTSDGMPICWIMPLSMMTTRSATSNASSWSWVTKSVVMGFVLELAEPGAEFLANLGVESAEGLVEKQDLRPDGKSAGKGDALALAAGELRGQAAGEVRKLDGVQELLDASADLGFRRALRALLHAEAEGDVLEDAHVLEERIMLENEAGAALVGAAVGHVAVIEEDLALLGKFQAGDDAQEGGLARAAGAKEREEFAVVDGEAHAIQGRKAPEFLENVLDLNAHDLR